MSSLLILMAFLVFNLVQVSTAWADCPLDYRGVPHCNVIGSRKGYAEASAYQSAIRNGIDGANKAYEDGQQSAQQHPNSVGNSCGIALNKSNALAKDWQTAAERWKRQNRDLENQLVSKGVTPLSQAKKKQTLFDEEELLCDPRYDKGANCTILKRNIIFRTDSFSKKDIIVSQSIYNYNPQLGPYYTKDIFYVCSGNTAIIMEETLKEAIQQFDFISDTKYCDPQKRSAPNF